MKIVFMGTPAFAVPSLERLLDRGHEIAAVVSQPDRPAGRGQRLQMPPVKGLALARGIPVEQPAKLRDPRVAEWLRRLSPEAIVVAAYGKILPRDLLEVPPRGAINVHGSLLPKFRGAAPIHHAILAGETETGITIMQMNERMDAGDMLVKRIVEIRSDDTTASLSERLAEVGAEALVDALDRLADGNLRPEPQREEDATLAPMIRKEQGELEWRRPAIEIERSVRAFTPWPGAFTRLHGRLLKVHRARLQARPATAKPGTVTRTDPIGIEIATGDGTLAVLELQLEGKRRLDARDFLAARAIRAGDVLGNGE